MAKYPSYVVTSRGERVDFVLDRSRSRKKVVLAVSDGRLTVRVPERFDAARVSGFIEDNLEWIHAQLEKSAEKPGLPREYRDGERFQLLGEEWVMAVVESQRYFSPRLENGQLLVAKDPQDSSGYIRRQVGEFITKLACEEIDESIRRLSKATGLVPAKVTVKELNASWGRCSSGGNISINYKIVKFSKAHIDYVCMHELAHLEHMDHSPAFWGLVERYIPDWKALRASMR